MFNLLPGATTPSDQDLLDTVTPNDITLPENDLPLLEQTKLLDDFETLMSLENDYDNSHLMPIGGTPELDVTKNMNADMGVSQELEIAMDNARYLNDN